MNQYFIRLCNQYQFVLVNIRLPVEEWTIGFALVCDVTKGKARG